MLQNSQALHYYWTLHIFSSSTFLFFHYFSRVQVFVIDFFILILCHAWDSLHLLNVCLGFILFYNSFFRLVKKVSFNPLTPNDDYSGRTAPLTSKCCILYIYSTNIGTEYFKHGIYSQFFLLQNAVSFINLTYLVPVLFTFYIQDVLKLTK